MAERVIQEAYYPRICVISDENNALNPHETVAVLSNAPKLPSYTVRNTRQMSATFTNFGPQFVPIPTLGSFPSLEDADKLLAAALESPEDPFLRWFESTLQATTGALSMFETWSHPVASVLCVDADAQDPITALHKLYNASYDYFKSLPFVNAEFIRFFCIVGTQNDRNVELLELVRTEFGANAAILDPTDPAPFVKQLMASVLMFMEDCCQYWYEQIVASKQGFAGRLFSVGRRYLMSSSKLTINVLNTVAARSRRHLVSPYDMEPLKSAYNVDGGYYHWTAPQAQLRKIADFAVILRDYKFAHGLYDMLKRDYFNEKAWIYAASCQEMTCTTLLLKGAPKGSAGDSQLDSLLDSTVYTWLSRCSLPLYALRTILQVCELCPADALAGAWLTRALGTDLASPLAHPLICERLAHAFGAQQKHRKRSLWLLVAARGWWEQGFSAHSRRCFEQCEYQQDLRDYPLHRALSEQLKLEA